MTNVPKQLRILDPAMQRSLYIDTDLGATGNSLAILVNGDGSRSSVEFDLDDVRNLHEWTGAVLKACEV